MNGPRRAGHDHGQRPGLSPALAGVTVAAAAGLARSFADGGFWWPVLAVGLSVHAIGAWCRRRSLPLVAFTTLAAAAVGLLVAWVIAGHRSAYGVPGPGVLRALHHWTVVGWDELRTARAPARATRGLLLWAMVGVGLMAIAAEVLTRRGRQVLTALTPSLVWFTVLGALGADRWAVATTVVYLVACGAFLAVVHRAETVAGSATGLEDPGRPGRPGGLWSPALRLGAVALVVGFATAGLVPGGEEPILDVRRLGRPGVGPADPAGSGRLDPLVDLRRRLLRTGDLELFRVEASRRLRWRVAGLERFDGERWSPGAGTGTPVPVVRRRPGTLVQRVEIRALRSAYLPAAATPVAIDRAGVTRGPGDALVAPSGSIREGSTYRVWSDPTPPSGRLPDAARRRLVALPADVPAPVLRLARTLTAGVRGERARAEALEAFLSDGPFRYDLSVPPPTSAGALGDFLRRRRGFCEHFAAAHATMARAIGLPARVVVGFTAGRWDRTSRRFVVTGRDAHAWTEVWIDGEGWVAFEPTPAGDAPGQADPALGAPAAAPTATPTTAVAPTAPSPTAAPGPAPAPTLTAEPDLPDPGDDRGLTARSRPTVVVAAVLAAGALVGGATRRAARILRRRRRRRAADPAVATRGAYLDALDHLAVLGCRPAPAATPREVAWWVAERAPGTGAALATLAEGYALAVYGGRRVDEATATRAWRHHREFRRHARRERRALRGAGPRAGLRRRRDASAAASAAPSNRRTA